MSDLSFDSATHTYYYKNKKIPSVSKIVSALYDKFDTEKEAFKYANKNGFTKEQVINAWNTQNTKKTKEGSDAHDFAEAYVKWKYGLSDIEPRLPESQKELGIIQYWNDVSKKVSIVGLEQRVYCEHFAGTFDVLIKTENYHIRDYKTNEEMFDCFMGKTLKYPFDDLLCNNFNKYVVQQNLYKYLLEKEDMQIESMSLIWLKKDAKNKKLYTKLPIDDYQDRIVILLKHMFDTT
jgi:hypothetical protein